MLIFVDSKRHSWRAEQRAVVRLMAPILMTAISAGGGTGPAADAVQADVARGAELSDKEAAEASAEVTVTAELSHEAEVAAVTQKMEALQRELLPPEMKAMEARMQTLQREVLYLRAERGKGSPGLSEHEAQLQAQLEEVRGRSDALERKLEAVTKQLLEQQQQGGTSPSKVSFSSGKGARRTRE